MIALPFRSTCCICPLLMLWLLSAGGCGGEPQATPASSTVDLKIGHKVFHVEIAATEGLRRYGLMNRAAMPADHGMIFVFRDEQVLQFYMKNTLIPLDIIYANSSGKVVNIVRMEPGAKQPDGSFTLYSSVEPARYAIELNAGAAKDAGVEVGDTLNLPPEVREPGDLE